MTQHTRRKPGRPPSDDRVASREQILERALMAFAEHGFEATSLRALSRDLGGSHGLVHHHFGTKDALWRAAVDHVLGQAQAKTAQLTDMSHPDIATEDYLRKSLVDVLEVAFTYPMLARIVLDEGVKGGPRLDYLYQNYFEPIHKTWRDAISRVGSGKGSVFAEDGRMMFFVIFVGGSAPFFAPALANKFEGASMERDGAIRQSAKTLADLIFDGLTIDAD